MCAVCVAQGIGYVGTALASLQVMGARAKAKRRSSGGAEDAAGVEVDAVDVDAVEVGVSGDEDVEQPVGESIGV
jgi:hypothetical protein